MTEPRADDTYSSCHHRLQQQQLLSHWKQRPPAYRYWAAQQQQL